MPDMRNRILKNWFLGGSDICAYCYKPVNPNGPACGCMPMAMPKEKRIGERRKGGNKRAGQMGQEQKCPKCQGWVYSQMMIGSGYVWNKCYQCGYEPPIGWKAA